MTHLDTSFLVDLLREGARGGQGAAHAMLDRLPGQELVVSVHVACELFAGAELSADPASERERVTSLLRALQVTYPSDRFAARYGSVLAELRRRGETVSTMDLLIGTAALVDDAPLVTRNARDFERLPGLRVVTY
ncbi:MAG TPA: type II toxin-antitoxin system VapC family toxin [Longimicrobiales bacterium]|nr:type II toxin-antitoxin system VapC family toxin [Longimicrobiales bacterium]